MTDLGPNPGDDANLPAAAPDAPAPEPEVGVPSPAPLPPAHAPLPPPLEAQQLDGRVVPYWWLAGLVSTAIVAAILLALLATLRQELRVHKFYDLAFWCAYGLIALKFAWTVIAPPWSWRRWRWGIDHELLTLRWGIISHYERVIPISRLQHVDLTRGPIERLFGLTTLVVHTAGTSAASFDLPGLSDARARMLRDRILAARGDDIV